MKIGLNSIGFLAGGIGGAETYWRNLVHWLQVVDQENAYVLFTNDRNKDDIPLFNSGFSRQIINLQPRSVKWYIRGVIRNLFKFDLLNPEIYASKVDLLHHPFSLLSPTCPDIPSVITFHDLQHEFYPEFFSKTELLYRKINYRNSAAHAAKIIAISQFTKNSLIDFLGVNPDKIHVIPNGYGAEFEPINDELRLKTVRDRYNLHKPFMFYPAATWPHKNHLTLLQAVRAMVSQYKFDGLLVLTGIPMQNNDRVMEEIRRLNLTDSVRVLGYVPYQDLPGLYNLARMLIFPSYFEGFGIPIVEAMACGCPIVCSNTTSLPEVAGPAAVLFDPHQVDEIAGKAWQLWCDEGTRAQMKLLGFERVKTFSWRNNAEETLAVYRQVA